MHELKKAVAFALFLGCLTFPEATLAETLETTDDGKAAVDIAHAYSGDGTLDAREAAEADHRYAVGQLAAARAEVERLISEIKIEGAEGVEIGGEIRAARMTEAAWQRAAETVAEYIARLDRMVAER